MLAEGDAEATPAESAEGEYRGGAGGAGACGRGLAGRVRDEGFRAVGSAPPPAAGLVVVIVKSFCETAFPIMRSAAPRSYGRNKPPIQSGGRGPTKTTTPRNSDSFRLDGERILSGEGGLGGPRVQIREKGGGFPLWGGRPGRFPAVLSGFSGAPGLLNAGGQLAAWGGRMGGA